MIRAEQTLGLGRYLSLSSLKTETLSPVYQIIHRNKVLEGFYRKGLLCGAEYHQIAGAEQIVSRYGRKTEKFEEKEPLLWFVLYTLYLSGIGHIRGELQDYQQDFFLWLKGGDVSLKNLNPDSINSFILGIKENELGLISSSDDDRVTPLLYDSHGGIYLYRRKQYELDFLKELHSLLKGSQLRSFTPQGDFNILLEKSFTILSQEDSLILNENSLEGAKMLERSCFSIITGGPGTGKTTLLKGIISLIQESQKQGKEPSLDIRLAAPTGRAAMRMAEGLGSLVKSSPVTLHKLLGIIPGKGPRYNEGNPLMADLVVVDEASMIDLTMMNHLFKALKEGARLLLIGDKDQLPSVEAGALLSDFLYQFDSQASVMQGRVLELKKVHRNGGAILESSKMVIKGNFSRFKDFLNFKEGPKGQEDFFYSQIDNEKDIYPFLEKVQNLFNLDSLIKDHPSFNFYPQYLKDEKDRESIKGFFDLYNNTVVLTPSKKGLWGTNTLNRRLIRLFFQEEGEAFHGMPLLITKNDYERSLYNGDRGVVLRFKGILYGVFQGDDSSEFRSFPLSLLESWEPAFAMTIHKSQGSEYGQVILCLPDGVDRLLSREIVYTGITRAKKKIYLFANTDSLKLALDRGIRRNSGIREFIINGDLSLAKS